MVKTNEKFDYDELYNRNLKRLAGLCNISKADEYTFPHEMSDFYEASDETFSIGPIKKDTIGPIKKDKWFKWFKWFE